MFITRKSYYIYRETRQSSTEGIERKYMVSLNYTIFWKNTATCSEVTCVHLSPGSSSIPHQSAHFPYPLLHILFCLAVNLARAVSSSHATTWKLYYPEMSSAK